MRLLHYACDVLLSVRSHLGGILGGLLLCVIVELLVGVLRLAVALVNARAKGAKARLAVVVREVRELSFLSVLLVDASSRIARKGLWLSARVRTLQLEHPSVVGIRAAGVLETLVVGVCDKCGHRLMAVALAIATHRDIPLLPLSDLSLQQASNKRPIKAKCFDEQEETRQFARQPSMESVNPVKISGLLLVKEKHRKNQALGRTDQAIEILAS